MWLVDFLNRLTKQWRAENPVVILGENSTQSFLADIQSDRDALIKSSKSNNKIPSNIITKKM